MTRRHPASHRPEGRRPEGVVTRGTTAPNRLRRVDLFLTINHATTLRRAADPLVVDLGYGASPVTTLELAARLARVRPDVQVVGIEIDPARVAAATPYGNERVSFRLGGFELPVDGRRPVLVRAMNVLRQYDAGAVPDVWSRIAGRLAPGGVLIDGTCDELGRIGSWISVDAAGHPRLLTLSARADVLDSPSTLAERLPKALIHRNVPGEPVHALFQALDRAWDAAAPYGTFGARARFAAAVRRVVADGWPVRPEPDRWRRGELSLPWRAVAGPPATNPP